jgi:hypothetical protein
MATREEWRFRDVPCETRIGHRRLACKGWDWTGSEVTGTESNVSAGTGWERTGLDWNGLARNGQAGEARHRVFWIVSDRCGSIGVEGTGSEKSGGDRIGSNGLERNGQDLTGAEWKVLAVTDR